MALHGDVTLISTMTLSLSFAFVGGLIACKLRLPPMVGYLLAGIIIGPHTPGLVADIKLAEQLSEIGILLLMFGVGMHFSFEDLLSAKRVAIPGAILQIVFATLFGSIAALYWGWGLPGSILLGLALSVASTVVLLRALEAQDSLHSVNGKIAVSWLIMEDFVMVIALVFIPTFAEMTASGDTMTLSEWGIHLGLTIGKIALFILLMAVVGIRVLPWLFKVVLGTGSHELFTLCVITVAMGVALGAAGLFDVSFAVGAFFAGMVLKEFEHCHKVAENALPFQDAFAVLFFVSVGMLFDPMILLQQPWHVLTVVSIILIGKSVVAFLLVLMFRYSLGSAFFISAGLAQIGEFSFILANLGRIHNLLPPEGHNLMLAGAIISIALNPVMFWLVNRLHEDPVPAK